MLNGLDLFSGGGMLGVALSEWVRPVAYCENDRYAQADLLSRMWTGQLPIAPIWDDVRTLRGDSLGNWVDIVYGGFPCQDISVAGNGEGLEGERSGLVFDLLRIVREVRPSYVFLENSPNTVHMGVGRVFGELAEMGFDPRWTCVSAAEVGAPHLRDRFWMLAYADRKRGRHESNGVAWSQDPSIPGMDGETMAPNSARDGREQGGAERNKRRILEAVGNGRTDANTLREGQQRWLDAKEAWEAFALGSGSGAWLPWLPQPALPRGDDGLAHRVDKIRVVGNGVVPQAARKAFMRLIGIKEFNKGGRSVRRHGG